MYYLLKETMEPCDASALHHAAQQYVAVLTAEQWQRERESYDMGIELEPDARDIHATEAEVNYDSLTGTFLLPDRDALTERAYQFAFALDEKGLVLIDESGMAERMIGRIAGSKRWRAPSLERFLYDFLEQIVARDLPLMERYELELDHLEDDILAEKEHVDLVRVNEIRSDVRELLVHYEQLIDMAQELEENENGFFKEKNLRFFRLFLSRMARLHDMAASLRDHTIQVRDLYHAQLDAKQNRTMTILTIVTTVFMPLTLIAGWYGMNFRNMPELESRWGYPAVILVSLVVVVASLIFFKKKKWL